MNALGADHPLRLGVQLDSQGARTFQPMPDATPGNLPDAWNGPDGFVANAIVPVTSAWNNVSPGAHTFKIWMIEPTVVVQKIVIGTSFLQLSYTQGLISWSCFRCWRPSSQLSRSSREHPGLIGSTPSVRF
jgi:hypothetical protein